MPVLQWSGLVSKRRPVATRRNEFFGRPAAAGSFLALRLLKDVINVIFWMSLKVTSTYLAGVQLVL